jgi:hypothetical protein
MDIIEKSVNDWLLLQFEMTEKQIEMNRILLTDKIKRDTKDHKIIEYFVNKNQIILHNEENEPITFNLNVHPTIYYEK